MTSSPTPSFEREIRSQIAAAQAAAMDANSRGDEDLVHAAQDRLDGLFALASRNGLELDPIDIGSVVVLPEPSAEPVA
jgi:hypothetical protein